MNVEDTIKLSSEQILSIKRGDEQFNSLPTILDVVEYLARKDNDSIIDGLPDIPNLEGKYMPVAGESRSRIVKFMPMSQSTFTYMRGQNVYKKPCLPLLYRKENGFSKEDSEIIAKIRTSEFIRIVQKHPIIRSLGSTSDFLGIAQHYGMRTNLLDITNNKWVAAFFACTKNENDIYYPVEEDYEDGIGVVYVTNKRNIADDFHTLGYQYFERPSRQYSFTYGIDRDIDFDDDSKFDRIIFRHDITASTVVFNMAYAQNRFFPNDELSVIAKAIRQNDYPLSWNSIEYGREHLGITESDIEIINILKRNNIQYHNSPEPKIGFSEEQVKKEWDWWVKFKSLELARNTLPAIPLFRI